jgi:hypothetical protein
MPAGGSQLSLRGASWSAALEKLRSTGALLRRSSSSIWALRVRLQMVHRTRELALFDLGIDSKLRRCDLVTKVRDVCHGDQVASRATIAQQKTQRPVQFEIIGSTRETFRPGQTRPA